MKRDIDLARQLLLDIESRGMDCSVSVLRGGPKQDAEERIRYHLRLLIDAGFLKEVDRTTTGVPCIRLTHDGHEFVELSRSERRWRDAKWVCYDRTGGLSLTIMRNLLTRGFELRRPRLARRARTTGWTRYAAAHPWDEAAYRVEPYYGDEPSRWTEDAVQYVPVRPDYVPAWRRNGVDLDGDGMADVDFEPTLPDELI
ncbi:MAG: DUF2513 domain-containing protein [Planctomycetota bacterium]